MRLDEAKQILKKAGYLIRSLNEDTETDDDAYADAKDSFFKNYDIMLNTKSKSKKYRDAEKKVDKAAIDMERIKDKRVSLADKIKMAKKFNGTALSNVSSLKDIIPWAKSKGFSSGWEKNSDDPCVYIKFSRRMEDWIMIYDNGDEIVIEGPYGTYGRYDGIDDAMEEIIDMANEK